MPSVERALMPSGASNFNPTSYAARLAAAGMSTRPKSDYGIAMAAQQQQQQRRGPSATHKNDAPATHTLSSRVSQTSSPQRERPASTGGVQRSPRAGSATNLRREGGGRGPQGTSPTASENTAHVLSRVMERSGELDEAASTLLAHLQHTVVDISRHIVAERRCAAQLRQRVESLEAVIQEQEVSLDSLLCENEALRREQAQFGASGDTDRRRRLVSSSSNNSNDNGGGATAIAAYRPGNASSLSAAEVDRCVCAEFERLECFSSSSSPSPISGGYRRPNPFDRVSPDVAAVLRSLATQVVHLRQSAARGDALEGRPEDYEDASEVPVPRTTQHPSALERKQGHNPNRPAAADAVVLPSAASVRGGAGDEAEEEERIPAAGTFAPLRHPSESSTSVDSAVYEDAATILSDIRARYGL